MAKEVKNKDNGRRWKMAKEERTLPSFPFSRFRCFPASFIGPGGSTQYESRTVLSRRRRECRAVSSAGRDVLLWFFHCDAKRGNFFSRVSFGDQLQDLTLP